MFLGRNNIYVFFVHGNYVKILEIINATVKMQRLSQFVMTNTNNHVHETRYLCFTNPSSIYVLRLDRFWLNHKCCAYHGFIIVIFVYWSYVYALNSVRRWIMKYKLPDTIIGIKRWPIPEHRPVLATLVRRLQVTTIKKKKCSYVNTDIQFILLKV